jgi:tripartite-type tricarboxylate transporter receptor subunit TctC
MTLARRRFLQLAAGAAALPSDLRDALAADYPTRPVKIIAGFPAGGAVDVVARLIADWLSRRLNGQFVVENRPGAANNIGTEDVIRAPADGYTLLLTNPTNAINATYYAHLNYNFLRDSDPVAGIMRVPNVLVVGRPYLCTAFPNSSATPKPMPGSSIMRRRGTAPRRTCRWKCSS